jgi:exodeoxyribonuclease X
LPDILFRVVDLETVGVDPTPEPCDGIVELGWTDVWFDSDTRTASVGESYDYILFNPPGGIPPEASAVHHVTGRMVNGLAPCTAEVVRLLTADMPYQRTPFALVAHNAKFERSWLDAALGETRWLCTYKVAKRVWPEWPAHNNHACRYLLGLDLDPRKAEPPHRAGPDAYVTAHVLAAMLRFGVASVNDMLVWTREPVFMPVCPIGEDWRGKPWSEVDHGFLSWVLRKDGMDADVQHWARVELDRRRQLAMQGA